MADEKILPRDLVENPEPPTQSLAILDDGTNVFATSIEDIGNRIGAVRSVQAGLGISVDNTDPLNPVVTVTEGGGDMFSAIYDPQGISNDAFARENHTGEQPISATAGLQDALDDRYTKIESDVLLASKADSLDVYTIDETKEYIRSYGIISLNDWAVGDGVTNDLPAVIAAANYANADDLKLVGNGRFKLVGSGIIDITTDADLSGVTFDCSEWTGFFHIGRKKTVTTYDSSSAVVAGLKSSADLTAGSARFSGWDSTLEVADSFVVINTTQDFFRFRDEVIKRKEFNRVFKDGIVGSPLRYDLPAAAIDNVVVYPMEDRRREVKSLTLDIRGSDPNGYGRYVKVQTSLLDLDVRFLQDTAPNVTSNYSYVEFERCCEVKARLTMQWPNRSAAGYTYCFSIGDSYNVEIEPHGDGDGWGAMGSNLSQRITIRGGELNRVDFHQPVVEWFKVVDNKIGNWGILVTMLGDLIVKGNDFNIRKQAYANNIGVIRSRSDGGGFCDGDLIMQDNTVTIDAGTAADPGYVSLIKHQQESGTAKPAGSPINYRFWRAINIDGLQTFGSGITARILPLDVISSATPIAICEEFNVRNARGENLYISCNMGGKTPSRAGEYPFKADFENVAADTISVISSTNDFRCIVGIRNCRGAINPGVSLETQAPGVYTVEGGCVGSFDLFSGGDPAGPVALRAYGAVVLRSGPGIIQGNASGHDIRLTDCEFRTDAAANLTSLLQALLVRPKFYVGGAPYVWNISNTLEGAGTFTLVGTPRAGQEVKLVMGYTANNQEAETWFKMPEIGRRVIIAGYHEVTGETFGTLNRTGGTTINAGGGPRFRNMQLA